MNNYGFLGLVHGARFVPLVSEQLAEGQFRLTTEPTENAPDAGEIRLDEHEGRAILVRGVVQGDWIHGATVVDQASPIVTVLVQLCLSQPLDPSVQSNLRFPLG